MITVVRLLHVQKGKDSENLTMEGWLMKMTDLAEMAKRYHQRIDNNYIY